MTLNEKLKANPGFECVYGDFRFIPMKHSKIVGLRILMEDGTSFVPTSMELLSTKRLSDKQKDFILLNMNLFTKLFQSADRNLTKDHEKVFDEMMDTDICEV